VIGLALRGQASMSWRTAAAQSCAIVGAAVAAAEEKPNDRLVPTIAGGAVVAIAVLAAGTARGWFSYPKSSVNVGIAVGPTLLVTFSVGHQHGIWLPLAILLEVHTVLTLAAASWFRHRRRAALPGLSADASQ